MKRSFALGLLLPALSMACGAEGPDLDANIQTRSARASDALVGLVPVLDFTEVFDAAVAERVVIDEVVLHVSDLRLLGLDPRIPTGGLRLVDGSRIVSLTREMQGEVGFSFPEHLQREDLAVYLHISPSPELEGSSVVVRGRFYARAAPDEGDRRTQSLLVSTPAGESAVDPDGEPASPSGKGAVDPDGEPASPSGEGAVDPDGEPADCAPDQVCQGLLAEDTSEYVSFELRGDDTIELQTGFDSAEALEVVLGIPAARWFTPEAVATMESALQAPATVQVGSEEVEERRSSQGAGRVVLRDHRMEQLDTSGGGSAEDQRVPEGDYSLRSGGSLDPDGTRGW